MEDEDGSDGGDVFGSEEAEEAEVDERIAAAAASSTSTSTSNSNSSQWAAAAGAGGAAAAWAGHPAAASGTGSSTGGQWAAGTDDVKAVFAHVDLDCFYVQVERSLDPTLQGVPAAVIQYNPHGSLADLAVDACRRMDKSNGSIIAVSYEARARGVTRIMRGDEARGACPDIALVQVPVKHGKADLTPYRTAGARVIKILARFAPVERASIDEAFADLTTPARALLASGGFGPDLIRRIRGQTKLAGLEGEGSAAARKKAAAAAAAEGAPADAAVPAVLSREEIRRGHVSQGQHLQQQQQQQSADGLPSPADAWWDRPLALWSPGERLLVCGAAVLHDMRDAVLRELGFTTSGGIGPSKLLAKLSSGMNKPALQTLVVPAMIPTLLGPLPIGRVRGLGGEFGDRLARDLGATRIGEVVAVPQRRLEQLYGESTAEWLWQLVRGHDGEKVEDRTSARSVGCSKTFYKDNLRSFPAIKRWLEQLASELVERLAADSELNERVPQLLTVSFQAVGVNKVDPAELQQFKQGIRRPNQPWPGNQNISRSAPLAVSQEQLQESPQAVVTMLTDLALGLIMKWQRAREDACPPGQQGRLPPLRLAVLMLSAGKFLEIGQTSRISHFFSKATPEATAGGAEQSAAAPSPAPSPFKVALPPAAAASGSGSGSGSGSQAAGGGKRKAGTGGGGGGGGGIEDFLKRKKEGAEDAHGEANGNHGSAPPAPALAPEEVDPAVLAALPPDIRREVEAAMQQQQRQQQQRRQDKGGNNNNNKKGGALDSYFARAAAAGHQKAPPNKSAPKPKLKPLDRFFKK